MTVFAADFPVERGCEAVSGADFLVDGSLRC